MTRTARQLLDDVLALPEAERLEIASRLIDSVEGAADDEWSDAWLAELERRSDAASAREEPAPEWSEVRARILHRLTGQR